MANVLRSIISRRLIFLATALGLGSSVVSSRAQTPGSIDPTFDNTENYGGIYCTIAVQTDGKIVQADSYVTIHNITNGFVSRLNADGSPDDAFQSAESGAYLNRVVAQSDGKILLGGKFGDDPKQAVCERLNPDGSLDTGFQDSLGGEFGEVRDIVLQNDGKILVGGSFQDAHSEPLPCLVRLNADGTVDDTFRLGILGGSVDCLALQGDGKIVAGGFFYLDSYSLSYAVLRFNADGSVDPTFTPPEQNELSYFLTSIAALAVQGDGKIIRIGATASLYAGTHALLFDRLQPDGSVDAGFQPYPTYLAPATFPTIAHPDVLNVLRLQSDGSIIVGGIFHVADSSARVDVARFNPGGELDTRFAATPIDEADVVYSFALSPDGKIVLGGIFHGFDGVTSNNVARLFARTAPAAVVELHAGGDAREGQTNGKAIITRSGGDVNAPLTVRYKVKGTAAAGVDYKTLSGAVVFPPGAGKAKIKVKPIADSPNTGTRKVKVILLPATDGGYEVGNGKAKIKIVDR